MKKLLCLLLSFGLLTGCQPVEQGEPEPMDIPKDEYVWEEVGAAILLPEGTREYCDISIGEDGSVWFHFKDGGDTVFWLTPYEKPNEELCGVPLAEPLEEQLGVFTLGETDTHIIQVMTSTCGTLNNEEMRDLWDEMRGKVAEMTEENILLIEE